MSQGLRGLLLSMTLFLPCIFLIFVWIQQTVLSPARTSIKNPMAAATIISIMVLLYVTYISHLAIWTYSPPTELRNIL